MDLRTISPSQMRVWEHCPKQWEYMYELELHKAQASTMFFDFGNYTHELLHVFYRAIKANPSLTNDFLNLMLKARVQEDLGMENIENVSRVWPRVESYVLNQHPQIDRGIKILGVELEFKVPVMTPKGREVALHGFMDLMYQDQSGRIRIRDHKTGGNKNTHNQNSVKLDDQLLFYAVAMSEMYNQEISDVEINFVNSTITKKAQPLTDVFALHRYQHTPVGLAIAKQNILQKIDIMLDKATYKNYSPTCPHCPFFEICHLEIRGMNTNSLIASNYERGKRVKLRNRPATEIATSDEYSSGDQEFTISFTDL